jgi:phosphatidylglycerophosphate synthase
MRNIPNILTMLRIVWLPTMWVFLYQALFEPSSGNLKVALIFLFVLGLTDLLDGYLAKRNNGAWKSVWGAKMDPIADKALFWTCILLVWPWMLATAADIDDPIMMLAALVVVLYAGAILLKHAQLDITSTTMRSVDAKSARTLGRLKFVCDLGAIAVAMIGAQHLDGTYNTALPILIAVFWLIWMATFMAKTNVEQRQAALVAP